MHGLNLVMLIGNLGADPELKQINAGTDVCNFTIATSKKVNEQEYTEWHKCSAFGKTAQLISEMCSKGDMIHVHGEIRTRSWEKDGHKNFITEINVYKFWTNGKKPADAGSPTGNPAGSQQPAAQQAYASAPAPDCDDDLPF